MIATASTRHSLARRLGALLATAIVVGPTAVRSQEPVAATHTHAPLVIDADVGWDMLLAAALEAYPRSIEQGARAEEAAAWDRRGRALLAAAPELTLTTRSDRPLDVTGQREYEGGIALPLWYAGQRRAVQAFALTAATETGAAAAELRWEVAGLLRSSLWDIALADNALQSARDSAARAAELVHAVELRNARGDLPLADLLLARAAALEKQKTVLEGEAALQDAERGYRSLTGLDRRPRQFTEVRVDREDLDAGHPALALANAALERARAELELIDRESRGNLVVTIGPRRQRDPYGVLYADSLGASVRIPVGTKTHGATDRAQAARRVADAGARRRELERRLDLDLHEAEHGLSVIERSLALADEQAALAAQQRRMAQAAFAQGEIELRELLRIEASAESVFRDRARLRIAHDRAIAAINQALGEIP